MLEYSCNMLMEDWMIWSGVENEDFLSVLAGKVGIFSFELKILNKILTNLLARCALNAGAKRADVPLLDHRHVLTKADLEKRLWKSDA